MATWQKEAARAVGERLGRYTLLGKLGSGGMATVYLARQSGPVGFVRRVAIKRLHPHLVEDPAFVSMFVDEARLASSVRHPNVVPTLDVLLEGGELALVMDYVEGGSLSQLLRASREAGRRVPPAVAAAVAVDVLNGLQAAHEACDERGQPLGIVHRDLSPHNVMVGVDGVARLVDFGVAKAAGRSQLSTESGQLKGKFAYMAPEQISQKGVGPRSDQYAAAIVVWEMLTGRRLFEGEGQAALIARALSAAVPPPSSVAEAPAGFDAIVLRGLAAEPSERFDDARAMARAIERACAPAPAWQLSEWVTSLLGPELAARRRRVVEFEASLAAAGGGAAAAGGGAAAGAAPAAALPALPALEAKSGEGGAGEAKVVTEMVLLAREGGDEVASTTGVGRRARPSRWLSAVLAFAAAAAAAGVFVARGGRGWGGASEAATDARSAVAPASGARAARRAGAGVEGAPAAAAAASASAPASAALAALEATSPPAASARAKGEVSGHGASRAVAPRAAPRGQPEGARAGGADCDPPFTYDAEGIRHIKRECL